MNGMVILSCFKSNLFFQSDGDLLIDWSEFMTTSTRQIIKVNQKERDKWQIKESEFIARELFGETSRALMQ